MKTWLLTACVLGWYVFHQDVWFWDHARPLVFGFLPIGLFYHALYSASVVLLMIVLVRYAWPTSLEQQVEDDAPDPAGEGE